MRTAPFILSRELRYLDEPNRFLREVASGLWRRGQRSMGLGSTRYYLSDNTIQVKAAALENFWSYIEIKKLIWRELSYDTVLLTYDRDMATGVWTQNGKSPLAASTINLRVSVVCEFMEWAHERGHRLRFDVPVTQLSRATCGGRAPPQSATLSKVRIGRHRTDPRHLRLPTLEEITAWLREIEVRRGPTKALACRMILSTGMRLEECVLLRATQVNDALAELQRREKCGDDANRWVGLEICFGTKGGRRAGDTERRGKRRILRVRPNFLEGLERYVAKVRPFAVRRYRDRNPGRSPPLELLLSERSGEPITRGGLYKAWHECRTLPFPGWSPHMGRHAWACFMLLSHVERERRLLTTIAAAGAAPTSWAMQIAVDFINIVLRPAMGHVSERTTESYLGWLDAHLLSADLQSAWVDFLEDGFE